MSSNEDELIVEAEELFRFMRGFSQEPPEHQTPCAIVDDTTSVVKGSQFGEPITIAEVQLGIPQRRATRGRTAYPVRKHSYPTSRR